MHQIYYRKRNTTHNMTSYQTFAYCTQTLTHRQQNIVKFFITNGKFPPIWNRTNNLCVCLKWNSLPFSDVYQNGKEVNKKNQGKLLLLTENEEKEVVHPAESRCFGYYVRGLTTSIRYLYMVRELLVTIATIYKASPFKINFSQQQKKPR